MGSGAGSVGAVGEARVCCPALLQQPWSPRSRPAVCALRGSRLPPTHPPCTITYLPQHDPQGVNVCRRCHLHARQHLGRAPLQCKQREWARSARPAGPAAGCQHDASCAVLALSRATAPARHQPTAKVPSVLALVSQSLVARLQSTRGRHGRAGNAGGGVSASQRRASAKRPAGSQARPHPARRVHRGLDYQLAPPPAHTPHAPGPTRAHLRARPTSPTLQVPSRVSSTLHDFMSRCTILCLCKQCRPRATSVAARRPRACQPYTLAPAWSRHRSALDRSPLQGADARGRQRQGRFQHTQGTASRDRKAGRLHDTLLPAHPPRHAQPLCSRSAALPCPARPCPALPRLTHASMNSWIIMAWSWCPSSSLPMHTPTNCTMLRSRMSRRMAACGARWEGGNRGGERER